MGKFGSTFRHSYMAIAVEETCIMSNRKFVKISRTGQKIHSAFGKANG